MMKEAQQKGKTENKNNLKEKCKSIQTRLVKNKKEAEKQKNRKIQEKKRSSQSQTKMMGWCRCAYLIILVVGCHVADGKAGLSCNALQTHVRAQRRAYQIQRPHRG